MSGSRPISRGPLRLMGLALFGNGILGLALVGVALGALGPLVTRASVAADSAGDSLAAAAQALEQTATAFDGFSKSLDDAKTSSAHASQLLSDASTTSAQLADAMSINFLGAQPFLPIAQSFRRNTDELRGVAGDLSTLSEAIGHNSTDIVAVRDAVRVLRDRVQKLATDAAAAPNGRRVGPELSVLAYGLTLWLGVLALLSLIAGVILLRI
jgi:ABC-type transporter Mla subunit MlaD